MWNRNCRQRVIFHTITSLSRAKHIQNHGSCLRLHASKVFLICFVFLPTIYKLCIVKCHKPIKHNSLARCDVSVMLRLLCNEISISRHWWQNYPPKYEKRSLQRTYSIMRNILQNIMRNILTESGGVKVETLPIFLNTKRRTQIAVIYSQKKITSRVYTNLLSFRKQSWLFYTFSFVNVLILFHY